MSMDSRRVNYSNTGRRNMVKHIEIEIDTDQQIFPVVFLLINSMFTDMLANKPGWLTHEL